MAPVLMVHGGLGPSDNLRYRGFESEFGVLGMMSPEVSEDAPNLVEMVDYGILHYLKIPGVLQNPHNT